MPRVDIRPVLHGVQDLVPTGAMDDRWAIPAGIAGALGERRVCAFCRRLRARSVLRKMNVCEDDEISSG
jgi:hypothetical protein